MLAGVINYVRMNAIAFVALFVALGGAGAYAAATIGANDIKDNAVRSNHIKAGEVKAADVFADGSVTINFDSIPSGSCTTQGTTVEGVNDGHHVLVTPPNTADFAGFTPVFAQGALANDQVIVRACNFGPLPFNPAEAEFSYLVVK